MKKEIEIDFEVTIEQDVLDQIEVITSEYENELGALLLGEITKEGVHVDGLIYPKQSVSKSAVDIEAKDYLKARKENEKDWKRVIGFWHSHNTMSSFWSSGDEDGHIKLMGSAKDLSVFIVSSYSTSNKTFDHRVRVQINAPFKITLDELPLFKEVEDRSEVKKRVEKIIKDVVIPAPERKPNTLDSYVWKKKVKYYFLAQECALKVENLTDDQMKAVQAATEIPVKTSGWGGKDGSYVKINAPNTKMAQKWIDEVKKILDKVEEKGVENPYPYPRSGKYWEREDFNYGYRF